MNTYKLANMYTCMYKYEAHLWKMHFFKEALLHNAFWFLFTGISVMKNGQKSGEDINK